MGTNNNVNKSDQSVTFLHNAELSLISFGIERDETLRRALVIVCCDSKVEGGELCVIKFSKKNRISRLSASKSWKKYSRYIKIIT